jgi:hypothetical protein
VTAPKITIDEFGTIYLGGEYGGDATGEAADAIRAALAELEALRPAPPEPVLVTQLKGRTIDGETEPVNMWRVEEQNARWWDADGTIHVLPIDRANLTVLCRPLDADA